MATTAAREVDPTVVALFARVADFIPTAWKLTASGGIAVDCPGRKVCILTKIKGRIQTRPLTGEQLLAVQVHEEFDEVTEQALLPTLLSVLCWAGLFAALALAVIEPHGANSLATNDLEEFRRAAKESAAIPFGLAGAVVGAVLGTRRTTRYLNQLDLVITTAETDLPLHIVPFLEERCAMGTEEYANAMKQVLYWKALLTAVSRPAPV
jgi:hypothetical protein